MSELVSAEGGIDVDGNHQTHLEFLSDGNTGSLGRVLTAKKWVKVNLGQRYCIDKMVIWNWPTMGNVAIIEHCI